MLENGSVIRKSGVAEKFSGCRSYRPREVPEVSHKGGVKRKLDKERFSQSKTTQYNAKGKPRPQTPNGTRMTIQTQISNTNRYDRPGKRRASYLRRRPD